MLFGVSPRPVHAPFRLGCFFGKRTFFDDQKKWLEDTAAKYNSIMDEDVQSSTLLRQIIDDAMKSGLYNPRGKK